MWRIARPAGVVSGKPASAVNPGGVVRPVFGISVMDCGFEVSESQSCLLVQSPARSRLYPRFSSFLGLLSALFFLGTATSLRGLPLSTATGAFLPKSQVDTGVAGACAHMSLVDAGIGYRFMTDGAGTQRVVSGLYLPAIRW
jgi:hypothetical protein